MGDFRETPKRDGWSASDNLSGHFNLWRSKVRLAEVWRGDDGVWRWRTDTATGAEKTQRFAQEAAEEELPANLGDGSDE